MSFPKKGRVLPVAADGTGPFAALIAVTLRQSLGDRPSAIKVVARWTGAGERTVKNWFAGKSGPNGDHLMDRTAITSWTLSGIAPTFSTLS